MITKDLIDYLKITLSPFGFENFYDNLRDDKKTNSATIYDLYTDGIMTISSEVFFNKAVQLQLVNGTKKSEADLKADLIYKELLNTAVTKKEINGVSFYLLPYRPPIYLGRLDNQCHKVGLDLKIIFN